MQKTLKKYFFYYVGAALCFLSSTAIAMNSGTSVAHEHASEIINSLKINNTQSRKIRLSLIPFEKDKTPISIELANRFYNELLSALIEESNSKIEYVSNKDVKHIANQLSFQNDDYEKGLEVALSSIKDVDGLIIGSIFLNKDKISSSFRVTSMNGKILATTQARNLNLKITHIDVGSTYLSMTEALDAAARYIKRNAPWMKEANYEGIYYQNSGIQTQASLYFKDTIFKSLSDQYFKLVSDKRLMIYETESSKKIGRSRGLKITSNNTDSAASRNKESYSIKGKYWLHKEHLEIRILLSNKLNEKITWRGMIDYRGLPGDIELEPKYNDIDRTKDMTSQIGLELSSLHGFDPEYRIGEKLQLIIRVSRDSWVYCYYKQANGDSIQIFPNPFFYRNNREPLLLAGKSYLLPGDGMFPFDFEITKPTGVEAVKCFALSRNVTNDLPEILSGNTMSPIPKEIFKNISDIFMSIKDVSITEKTMIISVFE
ncbi:hypothetical protein A9Q89_03645 [Gammaproteobacteria bacterium 53_120_T64]|nr:hypothetical protein A9Q89_03645 [Gammaproteobacteria bacterium 53_120_T64]